MDFIKVSFLFGLDKFHTPLSSSWRSNGLWHFSMITSSPKEKKITIKQLNCQLPSHQDIWLVFSVQSYLTQQTLWSVKFTVWEGDKDNLLDQKSLRFMEKLGSKDSGLVLQQELS